MANATTLSPLEKLPLEILQEITGYLSQFPEALHAFSKLSSTCRSACEVHLFKECFIRAGSQERLLRDIRDARDILGRRDRFRYVQLLRLTAPWEVPADPSEVDLLDAESARHMAIVRRQDQDFSGVPDSGRHILRVTRYAWPIDHQERYGRPLQELTNLIELMSGLKRFEFNMDHEFPIALLDVVEKKPTCRLSLLDFRLNRPDHGLGDHEIKLIKSSRLDTIKVFNVNKTSDGMWAFLEDAAREMSSGLSPSLRHVMINQSRVEADRTGHNDGRLDRAAGKPSWRGFPDLQRTSEKGNLNSLSLSGDGVTGEYVTSWLRQLNCEILTRLSIGSYDIRSPGSTWMSKEQRSLTSLQDFSLGFSGWHPDEWLDRSEVFPRQVRKVADFLESIQGLVRLHLDVWAITESLYNAIKRHTSTLRHLSLAYSYDAGFDARPYLIGLLRDAVQLETVDFLVFSEHTNEDETIRDREQFCSALSQLSNLERVSLRIYDAILTTRSDPQRREDQHTLARSYWYELVKARAKTHSGRSWALVAFQCSAWMLPAATYRVKRDSFLFAGVEEEMARPPVVRPQGPRKKRLGYPPHSLKDVFADKEFP